MFFWNKDKQNLEFLMRRVDIQASIIENMTDRLERLEKAPHGIKKDGTPRAKPGRKAVS
jgi:hypothetical protein